MATRSFLLGFAALFLFAPLVGATAEPSQTGAETFVEPARAVTLRRVSAPGSETSAEMVASRGEVAGDDVHESRVQATTVVKHEEQAETYRASADGVGEPK